MKKPEPDDKDLIIGVLQKAKPKIEPKGAVLELACVPGSEADGSDAYLVYVKIKDEVDLKAEQAFRIERELRGKIRRVTETPVYFRWFTDAEANLEDLILT
jgi:hypothetical protein